MQNVEHEMLCHTSNHWGNRNCEQKFTKISGNNTRTTLNRFFTKTAILGTSHIIRKVLQAETWSLSGGVHHWLKSRSTRGEIKPVVSEQQQQITTIIIINAVKIKATNTLTGLPSIWKCRQLFGEYSVRLSVRSCWTSGPVVNTPASYSRGPGFESQPWDRL
jgi:hypothetical protein